MKQYLRYFELSENNSCPAIRIKTFDLRPLQRLRQRMVLSANAYLDPDILVILELP